MNTREYLSDEELLRLIDRAESGGLLSAPRDLKENTLNLICHSEGVQGRKNPEERSFASLRMTEDSQTIGESRQTEQKKKNARKQYYRYCVRVGLGCAACLTVLFSTGSIGQKAQSAAESISGFSQQIRQFSQHLSNALDQASNALEYESFGGISYNE